MAKLIFFMILFIVLGKCRPQRRLTDREHRDTDWLTKFYLPRMAKAEGVMKSSEVNFLFSFFLVYYENLVKDTSRFTNVFN